MFKINNWFKRNQKMAENITQKDSLINNQTDDSELKEKELEEIKAGVQGPTEEVNMFREEQENYINGLRNDELTEEQLNQIANNMTEEEFDDAINYGGRNR